VKLVQTVRWAPGTRPSDKICRNACSKRRSEGPVGFGGSSPGDAKVEGVRIRNKKTGRPPT